MFMFAVVCTHHFLIMHARVHKLFWTFLRSMCLCLFFQWKKKRAKIQNNQNQTTNNTNITTITSTHNSSNRNAQITITHCPPPVPYTRMPARNTVVSQKWCQTLSIWAMCITYSKMPLENLFEYFPTSISIFNFFECHFGAVQSLVKTNFTYK